MLAASFIIQNSSFNIVFYGWLLGDEDVYFKIYIPIPSGKKALSLKNIFSRTDCFRYFRPGAAPGKKPVLPRAIDSLPFQGKNNGFQMFSRLFLSGLHQ
jgi:hypothetical protein